jgi:hypothetical protein
MADANKGLGRPLFMSYVFPFDPNDEGLQGDPGSRVTGIGGDPAKGPKMVIYTWPFTVLVEDLNDDLNDDLNKDPAANVTPPPPNSK